MSILEFIFDPMFSQNVTFSLFTTDLKCTRPCQIFFWLGRAHGGMGLPSSAKFYE